MSKNGTPNIDAMRSSGLVRLLCPKCNKEFHRKYKDYDNGFGFCNVCKDVRVVRASQLQVDRKLDLIKAQLSGQMVYRNSRGYLIT